MPARENGTGPRSNRLQSIIDGKGNGKGKTTDLRQLTNADELLTIVVNAIEEGGGITFSRTRDGGAIAIAFYLDGHKAKGYAATREQWLAQMGDLAE